MKRRTMDEMITYFNQEVAKMDIKGDYKMQLLGMICAIGFTVSHLDDKWIYCKDNLPAQGQKILAVVESDSPRGNGKYQVIAIETYFMELHHGVIAWMPFPEPPAEIDLTSRELEYEDDCK